MVSLDHQFIFDWVRNDSSAKARWRALQDERQAVHISAPARASVLAAPWPADGMLRRRAVAFLEALDCWELDRLSLDCATMIADRLSTSRRSLSGVDLLVAACAIRHGESVLSRNPAYRWVPGLDLESY